MKKLILIAVISVSSVFGVFAQQDQKAKSILEEVTKVTKSYKTIKATFDYIMDNKEEEIHETNNGEIILKGQKYMLKLAPLGLEVYCDGKNVWTFMSDANEVSIADMDEDPGEVMNPSKIFTIYENGFGYKFVEEATSSGYPVYVIDLFPENKAAEYSKIRVQIDKQLMLIRSAEMTGTEGNNYIVRVKDLKTDVPANDGMFIFDTKKYPGIETIDLR